MSNAVERKKPPLPKGRGTTEGGGGIQEGVYKVERESPSLLRRQPPLGKGAYGKGG